MGTANRSETSVVLAAARTPIGRFGGGLADVPATALGGIAIAAALERSGVDPERIGQVILGHVLPAGCGQNPARQAAVAGGVPMTVPSLSVNKVCLSGMTAVGIADRFLRAGDFEFVVAGGMESMSRAPHLLPGSRRGHKYGEVTMLDHAAFDGLTDAYDGVLMGEATERHARESGIARADQDAFALASQLKAAKGNASTEIVPVETRKGVVDADESPRPESTLDGLAGLRPAFAEGGVLTAGNSSPMNDGASALVLATRSTAERLGLEWESEILSYATVAGPDNSLLHQPARAIEAAAARAGVAVADLDTIEINEAFAAVALASIRELGVDPERVNRDGGAIALGHPLGASGARLVQTLSRQLPSGAIGAAGLCGGGGQGDAIVLRAR
ncbi:acetyl-CoA C-acyltransferase [Glycomyces niveus]|uniref:Probable acetyl-CoA acetyltransferase n=1 Tax=Glycomyces niveus TaxID=2820287 RepID=A0ABS3U6K2_9ACTN|nr:acetyl-CoA C-acyltransferase [Glycomyces sp. NEAU-S30]MBO3734407.1 acetyl-CoA C-acyltransferase [Glycomyces sp. NEAU-S30]